MPNHLMPGTTLGKWSVGLVLALIFFLVLSIIIVTLGHQTGGNTFTDNLYISIPMALAGSSGLAALVTGFISILKYKERGFLVFITTGIGILVLIFLLGEFLVPQ
jgi:hypothetical protein